MQNLIFVWFFEFPEFWVCTKFSHVFWLFFSLFWLIFCIIYVMWNFNLCYIWHVLFFSVIFWHLVFGHGSKNYSTGSYYYLFGWGFLLCWDSKFYHAFMSKTFDNIRNTQPSVTIYRQEVAYRRYPRAQEKLRLESLITRCEMSVL